MNIAANRFLCSKHPGANISGEDRDIQIVRGTMVCGGTNQVMVGYSESGRKILCLSIDGL